MDIWYAILEDFRGPSGRWNFKDPQPIGTQEIHFFEIWANKEHPRKSIHIYSTALIFGGYGVLMSTP